MNNRICGILSELTNAVKKDGMICIGHNTWNFNLESIY